MSFYTCKNCSELLKDGEQELCEECEEIIDNVDKDEKWTSPKTSR